MKTSSEMVSVAVAMLLIATTMVEAQPAAECASKLVPCSDSLNSTTAPAKECCDSISDAITNDLKCICNLYSTGLLTSIGINVTEALLLPQKCGIKGDVSGCNFNGTSNTNTSSSVPPATPSGENGAGRGSWAGILSVILLICASIMVF